MYHHIAIHKISALQNRHITAIKYDNKRDTVGYIHYNIFHNFITGGQHSINTRTRSTIITDLKHILNREWSNS